VWSIDWGFVNPTALLMIAVDGDGRMHVYREFYQTHRRAEEVAKWAKGEVESGREPMPVAVLCDHDPECAASFQAHGPRGIGVTLADKGDKVGGIETVQGCFDRAGDGRPRIFLVPDMLAHRPDRALEDAGKPTGLMSEIVGYVWDVRNPDRIKDEPLDADSHSCDALRYAARWVEANLQPAPKPRKPRPPVNPFARLGPNTWA
jgi:hypothetical protein